MYVGMLRYVFMNSCLFKSPEIIKLMMGRVVIGIISIIVTINIY